MNLNVPYGRDKDFKTHQSCEGKCTVILFNDEVSTRLPNEEDKVYKTMFNNWLS